MNAKSSDFLSLIFAKDIDKFLKTILLFGAGKSATVLIQYLLNEVEVNRWKLIVADENMDMLRAKVKASPFAELVQINIQDDIRREKLIQKAHIVISMLPPTLHFLVAKRSTKPRYTTRITPTRMRNCPRACLTFWRHRVSRITLR